MSYIVNTTFIVMPTVHSDWYQFFTEKFIPTIDGNPHYGKYTFTRLLSEQVEKHFTYSLQIEINGLNEYKYFMEYTLSEYIEFTKSLYDAEALYFVSLLKVIDIK